MNTKKYSIFLLSFFLFFVCCESFPKTQDSYIRITYNEKFNVKLSAEKVESNINLLLEITNSKDANCLIPWQFLSFYAAKGEQTDLNVSWLHIYGMDGKELLSWGFMTGIALTENWEQFSFFLGKGQKFIISLQGIESNFYIPGTEEFIDIQYRGPLGNSNICRLYM